MKKLLCFLLPALLTSCEKNVDVNLPKETPKLVINSFFTPDSSINVQVTTSQSVLERPFVSGVPDAEVILFEEGQQIATLKLDTSVKFVYTSDNKKLIQAGKKYAVSVSSPLYGTVTAQSFVPPPVKISNATITEAAGVTVDGTSYNLLKLQVTDPADAENYYGVKVKSVHYKIIRNNQTGNQDTLWGESLLNLFLEPSVSSLNAGRELLYSDKLFNGRTTTLLLYFIPSVPEGFRSKGVSVVLITAGRDYYEYNKKLGTHLNNQTFGIISGEPVQMPNNVTNGYGIFAGYSEDKVFKSL
jgi:hypothetical protein